MRLSPASSFSRFAASIVLLALAGVLPWLPAAEDPSAPGLVATLKGHSEAIYSVAFTPDGKHVVTGSGDRTLRVWDSATGKEDAEFVADVESAYHSVTSVKGLVSKTF